MRTTEAVYIITLLMVSVSMILQYAISGSVYGIESSATENGSLEKFNIITGDKEILIKESCFTSQSVACFDNKNKIWNIVCDEFNKDIYMMRYNISSNKVLSNISLSQISATASAADAGIQCIGNSNNGNIYVFGPSNDNNKDQILLELITNSDGNVTINTIKKYSNDNIDEILVSPTFSPIFDSKRNMIYIGATMGSSGNDVMLYIDINDGNITKIINKSDYPIPVSIYDEKLDKIIGLIFDKEGNQSDWIYSLSYSDPVTLNITTKLNPFSDFCMWTNELSIDEEHQILYQPIWKSTTTKYSCQQAAEMGLVISYLIGIDINNGSIVTAAPFGGKINPQRDFPWDILYYSN